MVKLSVYIDLTIFLLIFSAMIIPHPLQAQTGWRDKEMEVKVPLQDPKDAAFLASMRFQGDIYREYAILYLIPEELAILQEKGLPFEITIPDLNQHYRGFWETRAEYHSYEEVIALMDSLAMNFPSICKKEVFGISVEGRELSALKISDSVQFDQAEPEIGFDGSIHGDEIGGAENLVRFARMLCLKYGNDPYITDMVDNREIWIYCLVNPDGRENMTRYNANGIDLNRDWGYMWDAWGYSPSAYSQQETKALRSFMLDNHFNIHISYHSGTEAYLYPWYYRSNPCAEDDENEFLGNLYSSSSGYDDLEYFPGYQLYPTNGGSVETSYGVMGNYGVAMEISYIKQPPVSQIMYYYNINEPSMLALTEYSAYGIRGFVRDATNGKPLQAAVFIDDFFPVYSDSLVGDFQKFVLSGTYSATAVADGYQKMTIENIVVNDQDYTQINFLMTPADTPDRYAYRVISCQIPGNNFLDEGNTPAVIGSPDQVFYSLGKSGWIVIEMSKAILDLSGNDIIVYEGDNSPEGYDIYAGNTMDGPWIQIGSGIGTQEFDLSVTGLNQARYFKIKDDGDGPSSGMDAGFDLDAIKNPFQNWGVYLLLTDSWIDDSAGNGNGRIDPGENVLLKVIIENFGNMDAMTTTGTLTTTNPYLTITQNTYHFGNILQGESAEGSFELYADFSSPAGETAEFNLNLSSNNGLYTFDFPLQYFIGQLPVFVADLDGNTNSGPMMITSMEELGINPVYATTLPENPGLYKCIFVCLGMMGNNHVLTTTEGTLLSDYLSAGGRLYLEGGDTWFNDPSTTVHSMFGITGIHNGYNDPGLIIGQEGGFASNMIFQYNGDETSVDRLSLSGDNAFELFRNQVPLYCNSIANDEGYYKTVGSSFEFGGLIDGQSTKTLLMEAILEFFGGILTGNPDQKTLTDNFLIYPNPANESIILETKNNDPCNLDFILYNISGNCVLKEKITLPGFGTQKTTIELKNNAGYLHPGIYLYKLINKDMSISGKLIVN